MKMQDIFGMIMLFSFISIIFIFIAVLNIGITSDYLLYTLQETVEDLNNQSILSNYTTAQLQIVGDDYTNFNFQLDNLWFFVYVMFWISSLVVAYRADRQNYFGFLGMLFYGTMFMLFILTIFSTLTDWFKDSILIPILPATYLVIPKFYYYLDHIGIFSAAQIVICMIINMVDFDFAKISTKKKQEEAALEGEEIV